MSKPVKQKNCKACGGLYTPRTTTQKACTWQCSLALVKKGKKKEFNKETRQIKAAIKSKGDWTQEAQMAFNKYIRVSSYGEPCFSCGRNTGAKMNAGHYLSVGGHPELRFEEDNCHLQCEHCNSFLSGNVARYRINLIEKIGLERVEWLEGPHEAKNYTIDDLKEIKAKYTEMARELSNG
jgi:hypothetical protein